MPSVMDTVFLSRMEMFVFESLLTVVFVISFAGISASASEAAFRAPAVTPAEAVPGFLWLEAEGFADYGAWRLDTQFTHEMGSAYLIAPGVCKPVGKAFTTVGIPREGTWRVWARTKDWLPEFSPGKFAVSVGGRRGAVLGASRREGWRWEKAGDFRLAAGPVEVALEDLSGAFARCDALLLTSDLAFVPPDGKELASVRRRLSGEEERIADGGSYDIVVVGSGTAGMGAALAAARTGAKVALVHDRPVLGGNASTEIGVGTNGAAGSHPNRKLFARETGLCEEVNVVRRRPGVGSYSAAFAFLAGREKRLSVRHNQRVVEVEKASDGGIAAVVARDTLTGAKTRFRAKLFIDCTGDGWVGVFADAERMIGREAKAEFNEGPAPDKRDDLIMSGCLMDGYLCYRHARRDAPVDYRTPDWAQVLPEGFDRFVHGLDPTWWIEHGGRFNEIREAERSRDELIRIVFAYWGWLKNVKFPDTARNAELTEVPYMNGRREGYRLVGDYVLTANDALEGRMFDDRISYGGWPLDTHDPLGMDNPKGNGYWRDHPGVPNYSIPYRCLYSKNVPNLMFAGRCQSVTHIALGSVRVEATLMTLGQAAGTSAALALAEGLSPREYGRLRIRELQQRLLKDDQYIPNLVNEDPADFARSAKVTATSVTPGIVLDRNDAGLRSSESARYELGMNRATAFDCRGLDRLEAVECLLESRLAKPVDLTARIYLADRLSGRKDDRSLMATAKGRVWPGETGLVEFHLDRPVRTDRRYVWVELLPAKGVYWLTRGELLTPDGVRAYGGWGDWTVVKGVQQAVVTTPRLRRTVDSRAEYVIDGTARPVDACTHGWISDPSAAMPQSVRLDFREPVTARQVRLYLDTDLTPNFVAEHPTVLLRDYVVEGLSGDKWVELAAVKDNDLRLRVHDFAPVRLTAVRVTVKATWGDPSARIFEIRVY